MCDKVDDFPKFRHIYIKPTHSHPPPYYYHLQYHDRHKKAVKQLEFWVFESYSLTQL